ncbi:MAG: hypothetical protein Unbinned3325contig1000_33 [Prokaryotic dsDNA virus sp.]|nr:MAG: hypothetical protein Unbinned3325contig1000_33 [Prokaryotic dsDNA virus sp.]|tara:strand:+ start:3011 stop:5284 length:2274 start_codon:yes stop_codon:yes gene_type:complete
MAKNRVEVEFIGKGDLLDQIKTLDRATKSLINTQAKLVKQGKLQKTNSEKNAQSLKNIEVRLEALNLDYKAIGISTKLWNSALKGSAVDLEKVRLKLKQYNQEQKKADVSTRILGGTFAVLRSKLLIVNFALGLGVRQIGRLVGEASRVESMATSFDTLAGATENSSITLQKLRDATDNTMSSFDLFRQANNAMILGVSKNSNEMAEMFDIAQRLGRALGRDTASSVESLITGIGRQSRLMLDNIGIIVKAEEAYERYAQANNTTVDALTDVQKKQAFLDETMASARQKVKTLGDETLNTRDTFDQLSASSADLATELGKTLAPVFDDIAGNATSLFSTMTQLLQILNHTKTVNLEYAEAQDKADETIEKYSKSLGIQLDTSASVLDQLLELRSSTKMFSKDYLALQVAINELRRTQKAYLQEVEKQKRLEAIRKKQAEQIRAIEEEEKKKSENQKIRENLNKFFAIQQTKRNQEALDEMRAFTKGSSEERNKRNQDALDQMKEFTQASSEERNKRNQDALNQMRDFTQFLAEQRNKRNQEALEQMRALRQATKDLYSQELLLTQAVEANISSTNLQVDVMSVLDTQQKFAVQNMTNLSDAMASAMINGQNMGDAVVNSLKAIATQLIAKAGVYALLSTFFAPTALAGATGGFLKFLVGHTGGLIQDDRIQKFATGGQVQGQDNVPIMAQAGEFIIRKEIVDQVGVDSLAKLNNGETNTSNVVNVTIQGGVVDDSYVNNTLIPALNKATSLGNKINA